VNLSSIGRSALAAGVGAIVWSLTEYGFHRWLMHARLGPAPVAEGHRDHHHEPTHRPLASPFSLLLVLVMAMWMALWVTVPLGIGFLGAYVGYERAHHYAHLRGPRSRYGRWLRRHHQHHHRIDARSNFGFTTPVWDAVFGTYQRVPAVTTRNSTPWPPGNGLGVENEGEGFRSSRRGPGPRPPRR
jgi:sterol desaturase/sphingolipid hydroxylase (fatty acid hydroxylase superfamily)